ncbi:MAG TPA: DUF4386 domain-containing protein [Terriglobia bacterium]|nr:DUF4386 domain-containing protein [Terriglobia bacterium]
MADRTLKTSPQIYARIGGVIYLILILAGMLGEIFVRGKLVVGGDPTATAQNIMASPVLWRMGIAGDLIMHVCDVPLMLVFYVLLRPVNKNIALLAVLFNLVQTSALVANKLNLLAALFLLGNADYLKAFEPHQLYALAYLSIKLHDYGFGVGLIFFGFECLVIGYLIYRSGFLPRTIGVLMQIAGICYLTNSFALILAPTFENKLFPAIMVPAFIAEMSLCLWLIVKGVNVPKWEEMANAGGLSAV